MGPADPRVQLFLRRSMIVRIATLSGGGAPNIVPLWFVERAGRICMTVRLDSPLARNIARNPDVVMLFDAERGRSRRRVLKIRGRARVRQDMATLIPTAALSAWRYYLSPGGILDTLRNIDRFGPRARYYRERNGCVIEVRPLDAEFVPRPDQSGQESRPSRRNTSPT